MSNFVCIKASFTELRIRWYLWCRTNIIECLLWLFVQDDSRWRNSSIIPKHEVIVEVPRWLTQLDVILWGFTTKFFVYSWRPWIYGGIVDIGISFGSSCQTMLDTALFIFILIKGTLWGLWIKSTYDLGVHFSGKGICWFCRRMVNNDVVEDRLNSELVDLEYLVKHSLDLLFNFPFSFLERLPLWWLL